MVVLLTLVAVVSLLDFCGLLNLLCSQKLELVPVVKESVSAVARMAPLVDIFLTLYDLSDPTGLLSLPHRRHDLPCLLVLSST